MVRRLLQQSRLEVSGWTWEREQIRENRIFKTNRTEKLYYAGICCGLHMPYFMEPSEHPYIVGIGH